MSSTIPTGVVSFLFTDVEGSTRLWESDADGMAASLEVHDRIMRRGIDESGGHVFSTAGDAFAAAFASPGTAAEAALRIQLELLNTTWSGPEIKVRMGIHTGTAEERGGDYFGPVLNRAARIMSAGRGGQILVSSVTAGAIDGLALHDLGTHRLKDLEAPERVFELRHPDLPRIDEPIRTVDIRRHNLPDYLTSFVGRSRQLADLDGLVAEHRLVSLTGVGGTGKTRLAVEAARTWTRDLPDGAWLVELAPVTNPQLIMTAVGDIWGLRPGEGATIEDVVARYLWSRELVLIVDNCEHLLEPAAASIKLILDSCPKVKVVATSRESLGIPGEMVIGIPSLGLPDATHPLAESEAALLFLDRARMVRADFEPDQTEQADIGRICTRIDGIPLGLELAAARLRSMSTRELADRLDESFRILSGSAKTALPRQRTLQATIDWSHDLLEPAELTLFRRLAVFIGGFDLAAAEAVCHGDGVDEWAILDHLDSLIDKSLLVPMHGEEGTRYRLLEPVRQYAQERLGATTEAAAVRMRHARHYAGFVAGASPHTRGPGQMSWERRLDVDYDNIRTAFTTLLEAGDLAPYLDMVFDLFLYWMHVGMHLEGVETALAALEMSPEVDVERLLKAWFVTAGLGAEITNPRSIEHARRGLAIAQENGDPNAIGRMELQLGASIRHSTTDPAYLGHLLEGRRLLEAHPEPHWWEPQWERGLLNLIYAAYLPKEDGRIREHVDVALEVFEAIGDEAMLAATLGDSAGLFGQADDAWIMGNLERSVAILERIHVPYWHGHALMTLGSILQRRGDHESAIRHLSQAVGHLEDCGDVSCWANSSRGLAKAESALRQVEQAGSRIRAVIDSMPILPMPEIHRPRTLDAAAEVLAAAGDLEHAAITLGLAMATPFDVETVFPRSHDHDAVRARVEEALGDSTVQRLLSEGASLDLEQGLERIRDWLS